MCGVGKCAKRIAGEKTSSRFFTVSCVFGRRKAGLERQQSSLF